MCTVSIVPRAGGFRLISNRDERRERAVALEPCVQTVGTRAAILPIDPVGGGSWIGVNDGRLAAALLNRHDGPEQPCRSVQSRGLVLRLAIGGDSVRSALEAVRNLDAARFRPFRLLLAQTGEMAIVECDGRSFAVRSTALDEPHVFSSSSLGDRLVDAPRRRLFESLMNAGGERAQSQLTFHRHQWPDRRPISVVMERDDAVTVSRTVVDVDDERVALEYESLAPCRPVLTLELPSC